MLIEKASEIISQKAYTLVDQAIEITLQKWKLRDTQVGPRGAFAGEQGVGVLVYPTRTRYAEQVPCRVPRF